MKVFVGFVAMMGFTVAANILMKLGAIAPLEHRHFGLVDWKTAVGLGSFGAAGVIYAWILAYLPLNVAQSFMAVQFIAVIFASALILSEPIPMGRWLGILLIFVGIITVSMTSNFSQLD
jgi:drug/metabolite transporter (DMT)-like permease